MSDGELERMIAEVYGDFGYSFAAEIEGRSDTAYAYYGIKSSNNGVSNPANSHYVFHILEDLVYRGRLPAGNILIEIGW